MLIHPFKDKLAVIPGTRLLEDPLGLSGAYVMDPMEPNRHWYIQWLLAPISGRVLSGIRAKLIDMKGFITFCNQRDLEVMMGHAKPGDYCQWTGKNYVAPYSKDWYGLCCDEDDLQDDLFERECQIREQYTGYPWLPAGLSLTRRLHLEAGRDVEEVQTLLWDMNPDTKQYPDPHLSTVRRRWALVERTKLIWERLP